MFDSRDQRGGCYVLLALLILLACGIYGWLQFLGVLP